MKIALVGGTHGNEPVGHEVVRFFENFSGSFENEFQCFIGNPEAFKQKKRYIDYDLNRSFGRNTKTRGNEAERASFLTKKIEGQFDFCIDLHTTTSNMGLTAILNNTHINTRKACVMLASSFEGFKLIEEKILDGDCTHLNRLCPGGVTIEVGPVANNVVSGNLVLKTIEIVKKILDFDFSQEISFQEVGYYKMEEQVNFPEEQGWYIHPDLENNDFLPLSKGNPSFIHLDGRIRNWESSKTVYPFFINEAAYLENRSAFLISTLKKGWPSC